MEVGAISALGGASPDSVAAAPANTGFVIAHGGNHVLVDVAGFFKWSGVAGGVLPGELGDDVA